MKISRMTNSHPMTSTGRFSARLFPLFLTALILGTLILAFPQPASTQTLDPAMTVLRTEEYRGTECYRLLRSDGAVGFFSLTTGEMVSPWFEFLSFRREIVSGAPAYRAQDSSGNWYFLDPSNGEVLTEPVSSISPDRYQGEEGRTYYKVRRDGETLLMSAITGKLTPAQGVSLSPLPRDTMPEKIPADDTDPETAEPEKSADSEESDEEETAADTEAAEADTEAADEEETESYQTVDKGPFTVQGKDARIVSRDDGSRAFQAVDSGELLTGWYGDISPEILSYQDSQAVTVSQPDNGFGILSLKSGEVASEWYDFIGFAPEPLGSRKAYRVTRDGKTTFLTLKTGKTLDQWFDAISRNTLTLAGTEYYLVSRKDQGDALLSTETAAVESPWFTKIYPEKEELDGQEYYAAEHPEKGFGYIPVETGEFTQD